MNKYNRLTKNSVAKVLRNTPYENYLTVSEWESAQKYIRLAELEDKIESGTLLDLPCKAGDTVYFISNKEVMSGTVRQIVIYESGFTLYTHKHSYKSRAYINLAKSDYGEKWFTDEQSAEARLHELGGKR